MTLLMNTGRPKGLLDMTRSCVWTLAVRLTTDGNEVRLADYASAGNTWDDKSRFRVWIREP